MVRIFWIVVMYILILGGKPDMFSIIGPHHNLGIV
jgi:hypothetical protein